MARRKKQKEDENTYQIDVTIEILNLLKQQLELMREDINNNKGVRERVDKLNEQIDKMIELINTYTLDVNKNALSKDNVKVLLNDLRDDINDEFRQRLEDILKQNETVFLKSVDEKLNNFKDKVEGLLNMFYEKLQETLIGISDVQNKMESRLALYGNERPKNVWQFFYFLFSRRFKEVVIVILFIILFYLLGVDIFSFIKRLIGR